MIKLLDKKENWGIQKYGDVKISSIQNEVNNFKEEWLLDTTRQIPNYTHEHTQMYQLRFFHYFWNPSLPGYYKNVNTFKNQESIEELNNIYNFLEKEYNGKVVRAEIINMMPHSRIRKHRDKTDMLFICRRIHIPIKTNKDAIFTVNNDSQNMIEGGVYEINNSKIHNVFNYNHENRVHLIIDLMPEPFASNVSEVIGDDIWKTDKDIIQVDDNTRCVFCVSQDYCVGPHISKEDAYSFWEYIVNVIDDLSLLSVDIINDYSKENNLDLSNLSKKLYQIMTTRKY